MWLFNGKTYIKIILNVKKGKQKCRELQTSNTEILK